MLLKVILFDLDGTLLPMEQDIFLRTYFGLLAEKCKPYGYEKESLIQAIWSGTAAMVKNNGQKTNETVFWEKFTGRYGEKALADKAIFDAFYKEDFDKAGTSCGYTAAAVDTVKNVKNLGFRVALATNPVFPSVATEKRMAWAGLDPSDFELYTTYESIGFCKPNPAYYLEICKRLSVRPEECLMVGNDVSEDMVARETGMDVFLLTDCLINKESKDISAYPHGSFAELDAYLKSKKG